MTVNSRSISRSGGPIPGAARLWALGTSFAIFVAGATFAYQTLNESWAAASAGPGSDVGSIPSTFVMILTTNLGTAAFLYSGAVTFGLTTILGLGLVSAFVGATIKMGVAVTGWGALAWATAGYGLFEFLGFIVVGAAGLYPAIATIVSGSCEVSEPAPTRYLTALRVSLRMFALGASIIVLAAVIETLIIHGR